MEKKYDDLGFAKIDYDRNIRNGYPEIIYGEGKTPAQASEIFSKLSIKNDTVICTRANLEVAKEIIKHNNDAIYYENCRLVVLNRSKKEKVGCIVVATGGTSDISVADEATIVAETFGSNVIKLYDVGVAGIHRLLDNNNILQKANCIIAVAGFEGALPSVIAGLVKVPVIAVPTSVGYGASFKGLTALLAMLNSCASGVSVVNIDNGFGAAFQADMINKLAVKGKIND